MGGELTFARVVGGSELDFRSPERFSALDGSFAREEGEKWIRVSHL